MTTAVAAPPRPENRPRSRGARRAGPGAASAAAWCAAALVLAAGVALRVWPRSALWLDEAQSVAIARLPLRDIPAALREDGAPPLYYVLLHGWMRLVGAGDTALRTLSAVASIVTIPVLAEAARRWSGGRAAAWAAALLLAANPFAIRYAAETRMYAVVMLEVSLGLLAVHAALAAPTRARLAAVAALAAALLYTHYWALYLLAGAAATLAVAAWRRRGGARRAALACLGALGVGGALWLPWLPSFLFQARRTATPWAEPPSPADLVRIAGSLTGVDGSSPLAPAALAALTAALIRLAVRGWPQRGGGRPERAAPGAPGLAAVLVLCPTLALLGSWWSGSAFVTRYSSVAFPVLVIVAALGVAQIPVRPGAALLALPCAAGLAAAALAVGEERTPARTLAGVLRASAEPGDVVLYCPDQLGPALARELESAPPPGLVHGVFPDWRDPARVDWRDYAARHRTAAPHTFAASADSLAGAGAVWVLWSPLYPPTQPGCLELRRALRLLRPGEEVLVADRPGEHLDHAALLRYAPPPPVSFTP